MTGRVSDYMNRKRTPDAYTCVRMALILGRDPAEVIAEVKADTEKNENAPAMGRPMGSPPLRGDPYALSQPLLARSGGDKMPRSDRRGSPRL
jgi:hypothetical protein